MLKLDEPIGPINGLMCFTDSERKDTFYYVSERPQLARNNGVPEFVFMKYRRDITDNPDLDPEAKESLGGGFLAFTVDLGVDDAQLDKVKRELAKFSVGEVRLSPIQFREGTVRLSIMKDVADAKDAAPDEPRGMRLFEEIYDTRTPSLFGFNRATFGVVLTREGATMMEAALRSGLSPIGVIYNCKYLGLAPAFNVRVTADYHRIYEHLELEFAVKGQIKIVSIAADINLAFQKLIDEGAVTVEVRNFTDDADLRKQSDAALEWFKKELLTTFFQSSLQPPSFMTRGTGGGLLGQLQSLFGALNTTQPASPKPERGAPADKPGEALPQPKEPDDNVESTQEINEKVAKAATPAEGGGGGGGGADTNQLSPFQVGFSLRYYRQEELKTRVFDYSMQSAVAMEAAPQGLFSTFVEGLDLDQVIQEVKLDDDFFTRLLATVSMGGDLDATGIAAVAVNLEYPGELAPGKQPEHVDGFVFRPGELAPRTFTTWLNAKRDLSYRYALDVHFKPDSPFIGKDAHIQTGWTTTRERQLTIDPLDHIGLLDVEVGLGDTDSGEISQAQVQLRYDDGAGFSAEETIVLKPGEAGEHWRLRLSDPAKRTYSYRVTYFLAGNVRYETDWATSQEPTLVVNEPFRNELNLRVVPLLEPADLIEAVVDLTYSEPDTGYVRRAQELFTPDEPLRSRAVKVRTLAETPGEYESEVTVVRADGSVFSSGPVKGDDSVVVVSDGAGTTNRVTVKLLNPELTAAGLAAVKVDLTGLGEGADSASALFTASQTADQRLSLVQESGGAPFRYRYTVTAYTLDGQPIPVSAAESTDRTLLVGLPRL